MNLIQKIVEKVTSPAVIRASSIPLGITRTKEQMDALKKWN